MKPVIAVSDIHGQMLVFPELEKIRAKYPDAPVVFGGDYQDSMHHHSGFSVAQRIMEMQQAEPDKIFAIKGNHDASAWESLTGENDFWLEADGEDVIAEATLLKGHKLTSMKMATEFVRRDYADLIDWMGRLPLTVKLNKLLFVHAGLNLSLSNPIEDTPDHDKYWLREEYWFSVQPYFARNSLNCAIVSGHTPTSNITGLYLDGTADSATKRNRVASRIGVFTVQYKGEYARYFIDGGNHGGPSYYIGNIAVFDMDTGRLIEALENGKLSK
ncbi:metallophosphoesterase [Companilactobacillus muriivasis]|uniref:metallophosphoesterase n=1 Tax=Companilactobacillus muriivasis TaxID=3081444 RepID=UPI0030C6B1B5